MPMNSHSCSPDYYSHTHTWSQLHHGTLNIKRHSFHSLHSVFTLGVCLYQSISSCCLCALLLFTLVCLDFLDFASNLFMLFVHCPICACLSLMFLDHIFVFYFLHLKKKKSSKYLHLCPWLNPDNYYMLCTNSD